MKNGLESAFLALTSGIPVEPLAMYHDPVGNLLAPFANVNALLFRKGSRSM